MSKVSFIYYVSIENKSNDTCHFNTSGFFEVNNQDTFPLKLQFFDDKGKKIFIHYPDKIKIPPHSNGGYNFSSNEKFKALYQEADDKYRQHPKRYDYLQKEIIEPTNSILQRTSLLYCDQGKTTVVIKDKNAKKAGERSNRW